MPYKRTDAASGVRSCVEKDILHPMLKNIDISFWAPSTMPVVIQGLFGYASDKANIQGGIRTYHYLKLWLVGVEIAIAVARDDKGVIDHDGVKWRQSEPPA